jgi:hypothetical protein
VSEQAHWRTATMPVSKDGRTAVQFARGQVRYDPTAWATDYSPQDVIQNQSGICTFGAALASAANTGIDLGSRIRYLGNNYYNVFLYEVGWQRVYFDGTVYTEDLLPTNQKMTAPDGSTVYRLTNYWPLLFARAFLQYQAHVDWHHDPGNDSSWYQGALGFPLPRPPWASPKNANFALAGGAKHNWDTSEGLNAITHLLYNLRKGSVCTVSTLDPAYGGQPNTTWNWIDRSIGIGHQWAILDLYRDAARVWHVSLYNPWGKSADLTWQQFAAHFDTITCVNQAGVAYSMPD